MRHLYDEVLRRFPEVAAHVSQGDEELPYVLIGHLVEWLRSAAKPSLAPAIAQRVVDFDQWCMAQPRGKTVEDDIQTIVVVALREKLFAHDELLPLIPKLMSREELQQNREYLTNWVGADRYQAALRAAGSRR